MSEQDVQQTTEQKKEAGNESKQKKKRYGQRHVRLRIRLIPIWLRLIIVLILVGGSLLLGMMVGYGVIGDGAVSDALKIETWYHILDIMRGD